MKRGAIVAGFLAGLCAVAFLALSSGTGALGSGAIGGGGGGGTATTANFTGPVTFANESLTCCSPTVDFSTKPEKTLAATGNVTITTSNLAAGRRVRLIITADSTTRTLTLPTTWHVVNGFAPTFIPPSKQLVLDLDSTGTTDAGVSVAVSREGFAGERKQLFHSTMRDDLPYTADGTTPIPGTRRAFTITWGSFIECQWEMTGATNLATPTDGASDFGAQLLIDGTIAPEYDWHFEYVIGPGGGTIFHMSGNEQMALSPGLHNIGLIPRHLNGAGGETSFEIFVGTHDNQQDNASNFTCDEVISPGFSSATMIPQVAGTDLLLIDRWEADSGTTVNGSNRVSSWVGINGTVLAQATGGQQPLLVANCQNGLPCIRFDPTRVDALTLASPLTQSGAQKFLVLLKHNHQTTNPILTQCSGANCAFTRLGASTGGHNDMPSIESSGTQVRTASAVTGVHMLEFRWNTNSAVTGIRTDLGIGASRAEETGGSIASRGSWTGICGADDSSGAGCDLDLYAIELWQPSVKTNTEDMTVTDDKYLHDERNAKWAIYTQPTDIGG